tara:strand:+ start:105 stop:2084 length:1980 start_codon:yes stop_codon:yes gene_type:complete
MAKTKKMTETELQARVQQEIEASIGYGGDVVSEQREQSQQYYFAEPFGNEQVGRSSYVDSTVQDSIEWMKPSLMRVFASGDTVVTFNPVTPEDLPGAAQATDYINHVFLKENHGWKIMLDWFHDALLLKNGWVKVWYDYSEEKQREEYARLTDLEFEALVMDEDVEVIEHTETTEDVQGIPMVEHDVVIMRTNSDGRIRVENVMPDEILIARESRSVQESAFVCHRVKKTVTELREMGFKIDPDELSDAGEIDELSPQRLAKYSFDDTYGVGIWGDDGTNNNDKSTWTYWLHECYIRADYNNDGLSELLKVCMIGKKILSVDEVDRIPFVTLTPIPIPGKVIGQSIADLTMPLQRIKSSIMRNVLDSMWLSNQPRVAVVDGMVNIDDLTSQRVGGIIRTKTQGAIQPLPNNPIEAHTFGLIEYLDSVRESRTGVSKTSMGLNKDALTSHTTATAVNQVMNASHSRLELVARNFAETGVKELFETMYALLQLNQNKKQVVKLRNTWVEVRPDQWNDKMDATVAVGVGSGNKDQQVAHLSNMLQFATQSMSGGLQLFNEQNLYNIVSQLIKAQGFINVNDYVTDPSTIPPPEDPGVDPQMQMAQAEMQLKNQELEIKAGELELKRQKLAQEAQKDAVDAQLKAAELQLESEQNRAVAIGAT